MVYCAKPMAHVSLSARRRAVSSSDAKAATLLREPPLHVLVSRWLSAGWTVDKEIIEEAAQARLAERQTLKDPMPDWQLSRLIYRLPPEQRRYAKWLWSKCATDPAELLDSTLNSMFMGAHYANLAGHDEVLDALADLTRWRQHFNDFEADESYPWN